MFERFTTDARATVVKARAEARALQHPRIGSEHLLLGVLAQPEGRGQRALGHLRLDYATAREQLQEIASTEDTAALGQLGIDLDEVRRRAEASFGPGALDRRADPEPAGTRLAPRAKRALELSLREAVRRGDRGIGTEHVVLGILREGGGVAGMILDRAGVDRAAFEAALG